MPGHIGTLSSLLILITAEFIFLLFQLFSLLDESDETALTDDSYESSKKNLNRSHLEEKVKALQLKNKQLQNEVKALKHDRSITLENSNLVVIKHLIDMNKTLNYLFHYFAKILF